MRAIAPADWTMGEICTSVWPWVICEAVILILVMFFPDIGMWLPNRMG
jgi:TRAP-type mannitol/chloroaromatic compound transport system permease large subunit